MRRAILLTVVCLALLCALRPAQAKWIWTRETGWFRAEAFPRMTPAESLDHARKLYEEGKNKEALKELTRFLIFFPGDKLEGEVLWLAANASSEMGDYWRCHHYVAYYQQEHPDGPHISASVELDFKAGKKLLEGARRRVAGMPLLPGAGAGKKVLEGIVERTPYHPIADDAQLALGDFYLQHGIYSEARLAYETLLVRYPNRETAQDAQLMVAVAALLGSQGVDYDVTLLEDAAAELEYFAASYPTSPKADEASALFKRSAGGIARKDLRTALYYIKTGHSKAGEYYLRSMVKRYAGSEYSDAATKVLEALESGKSRRGVVRLAKSLEERLYESRPAVKDLDNELEHLGL